MTNQTTQTKAIAEEQDFVYQAYDALDTQVNYYGEQLKKVRAQGGGGTPGQVSERDSFASHYEDNLTRLRNVENRLVLGRLDTNDGAIVRIGRTTLRNSDNDIILTDWRAPQSEPFYQATAAHPGNIRRRRHIQTRLREVIGVEDELLTDAGADSADLNLTGEGALFAAMSKARDGRMGDIVATIQTEQDRIIRSDVNGILVVQGGPGTGKTAVALHRAAYLLYTHRERLARSGVLIIGPSPIFLRYIDQVLPALGESDVVSTTVDDLLPHVRVSATEPANVAKLKGDRRWAEFAQRAVRRIVEKPRRETAYIVITGKKLKLTPDMVEAAQRRARRTNKPHNQARDTYAKYLVEQLAQQLAQQLEVDLGHNDFLYGDIIESIDARREINLHWLPSSATALLARIYHYPELLARIAPELTEEERALLRRDRSAGFTRADIPILDELAEHLGEFSSSAELAQEQALEQQRRRHQAYVADTMNAMDLGGGIVRANDVAERLYGDTSGDTLAERAAADRTWTYGHVVVDEAQELSDMQWRMIARRNPARSMTIVGDVDQRPQGAPQGGWAQALGTLGEFSRIDELTMSYRTPASLLQRATDLMADLGHPVRPVQAVRDLPDTYAYDLTESDSLTTVLIERIAHESELLDTQYGSEHGTLAIIADTDQLRDVKETVFAAQQLSRWGIDRTGSDVSQRIHVMSARESKGLEFDTVIVVNPLVIGERGPGDLYVAMTRATRRMVVVTDAQLPPSLR
ncbi:HelD family protein [Arcanobacterium buesumense]|uniref:ATP-binding domain-containing protein n=1 Tax=Arcanobacterium buesumense TaxID=2722751 RepID=A0A6H2EKX0_9ACTO|nr:UvrD-helicase domain-containing protein [Arcanobacterium buesumense]QJC21599.1 ATP-binding domain-containing protein [Arcanobacterium buesumense]